MARRRQIYLVKTVGGAVGAPAGRMASRTPGTTGSSGGGASGALEPLGEFKPLTDRMAGYNIAPDGSGPDGLGEVPGMALLYGPGFTIEMARGQETIQQAIVSLLDEDFAWAVLGKMCKAEGWKMMDPETGRTFG